MNHAAIVHELTEICTILLENATSLVAKFIDPLRSALPLCSMETPKFKMLAIRLTFKPGMLKCAGTSLETFSDVV